MFSVINTVLLRSLPYTDPDQLVVLYEKRAAEGVLNNPVSPADYLDWAQSINRSLKWRDIPKGPADSPAQAIPCRCRPGR